VICRRNTGLRPVRQADILSAYLFARSGVQRRWAQRPESLCSSAILARLPLYQFFASSIRHSDPRSTPRGKRQKTAALQKLARVRTGLQIRVLWRFGNQYAETPALPKRDRTIDFNQPSNLNRLSRLPSFLGVMQVHPRLDIVAIFPTRPLLRLH